MSTKAPVKYDTAKSPTLEAVKSLLPILQARDTDAQHTYLSARYCGFSHAEACLLAKVSSDKVHIWRSTDKLFSEYESKVADDEFRKSVRQDTLTTLYYRNAFLIARKDAEILARANGMLIEEYDELDLDGNTVHKVGSRPLTAFERSYLLQIRKEYSPSQMATLEKLVSNKDEGFNISDFIKGMANVGSGNTLNIQFNTKVESEHR